MFRQMPGFALVAAVLAALLVAPSLMLGALTSQSAPQNLTWAAQFAEQFHAGILYPRWMDQSFDGLGSPAFYFYPPLPFWLDGAVHVATLGKLSAARRLPLDWFLLFFLSGLAMRAWLLEEIGRPRAAFWGALAYMAAPYHLLVDHYIRGAYAESAAYVFLPMVMLGVRRSTGGRLASPLLLALSYAGLLLCHLPTALLASITVLPAYALLRGRSLATLTRLAIGAVLGVALAAPYLLPAISLQSSISADLFWTRFYQVENWLLFFPSRWPEPVVMEIIASLAGAMAILAAGACLGASRQTGRLFWAFVCLGCLALIAGVVPWFWRLPEVAKVQFPWRLMVVVEFAMITALCLASSQKPGRLTVYAYAAGLIIALPGTTQAIAAVGQAVSTGGRSIAAQDVKEYEPRGFPVTPTAGYAELGLAPLKEVPTLVCAPVARRCAANPGPFGTLQIEIDGDVPTQVTARRFFFPSWHADGVVLAPADPYRLVSFAAPAGRTTVRLDRAALPIEQWGWALSGISLLLLAAMAVASARNIPR